MELIYYLWNGFKPPPGSHVDFYPFTIQTCQAMGKSKKRLDDLKKDLRELKKEEMKNMVGGRDKKNRWKRWLNICGNILPQ